MAVHLEEMLLNVLFSMWLYAAVFQSKNWVPLFHCMHGSIRGGDLILLFSMIMVMQAVFQSKVTLPLLSLHLFLLSEQYTVEYRHSAPHRLSAPPPLFFHIERIGIVNAPPLVYPPPPPPPFPSVLFLVISYPTASSFPLSRIRRSHHA